MLRGGEELAEPNSNFLEDVKKSKITMLSRDPILKEKIICDTNQFRTIDLNLSRVEHSLKGETMGEVTELEFGNEELKRLIKDKALLRDEQEGFRLASGRMSNYLFDLKPLLLDPKGSNLISESIYERIKGLDASYVGGLESGAIPIVTALCMYSWKREKQFYGFFVRKGKGKTHGVKKRIDGNFIENENVIIVDDVTTTGGSVLNAVKTVRDKGCSVIKVISIVDRLEGAIENFEEEGVEFESLFTRKDFGI